MLLARAPGHVLWTEDLALSDIASAEFGVRRVLTQVVVQHAAELGIVPPDDYLAASARLLGFDYEATSFNPFILVKAGELSGWIPERWPLHKALDQFAHAGGVRLDIALEPDLPCVRADQVRLRQVLLNLLSNAVKFTPYEGSVTLTAGREPDGGLAVVVTDTGIGIRPEDVPRAFEPFTQLEDSLNRRFPGSGLGLYLSRALAEAQGAKLTLHGAEGAGTTAVLRFPPERLVAPDQP